MTKRKISRRARFLLLFSGWIIEGSEAQKSCSIPPIYGDLHRWPVQGPAGDVFQYGSYIGVGNPAQNVSLWPSLRQNETTLAKLDFCRRSNLTDCQNMNGGVYDPMLSSSWKPSSSSGSQMSAEDTPGSAISQLGRDTIRLFTHFFYFDPVSALEVPEVPVTAKASGISQPGILGMGPASSLLTRLLAAGMVSARTYSLYIGTGFSRAGGSVNGSNVFGGYDAARFTGPVHTYDMDLDSPDFLPVNVTDIIIDHPSLERISIMDEESFQARITTDQYPLLLPLYSARKFRYTLGAEKSNLSDHSFFLRNETFNSSMTIVLSDGFNVTLPPSILRNAANNMAAVQTTGGEKYAGAYYLSTAWLTEVYLMLDFDAQKFHLAKAIKDAKFTAPETLCPGETPFSRADQGSGAGNLSSRPSMLGAILGGTFGGLAVLVIGWVVLLHFKRRRRLGNAEEGKLRHEPLHFFSDEELRHPRDVSVGGDSTKTFEMKSLGAGQQQQQTSAPAPVPAARKAGTRAPGVKAAAAAGGGAAAAAVVAGAAPTAHRRDTESTLSPSEPETDLERGQSIDTLAAVLRNPGSAVHSPTVQHTANPIVSRSVSPVSTLSSDSDRAEEAEEDDGHHAQRQHRLRDGGTPTVSRPRSPSNGA